MMEEAGRKHTVHETSGGCWNCSSAAKNNSKHWQICLDKAERNISAHMGMNSSTNKQGPQNFWFLLLL